MAETTETTQTTPKPVRAFWLPKGKWFDLLPVEIRGSIEGIVDPLYRQLVLEAADPVRCSAGLTVCHLTWLEVLESMEMACRSTSDPEVATREYRNREVAQYLRIAGAKMRALNFLLRLDQFKEKCRRQSDIPPDLFLMPPSGAEDSEGWYSRPEGQREEGRGESEEEGGKREEPKDAVSEIRDSVDKTAVRRVVLPGGPGDFASVEAFRAACERTDRLAILENSDPVNQKAGRRRREGRLGRRKNGRKRRAKAKRPR